MKEKRTLKEEAPRAAARDGGQLTMGVERHWGGRREGAVFVVRCGEVASGFKP